MTLITPNTITTLRILLALVAIFLFVGTDLLGWRILALFMIIVAMISDAVDGWLARSRGLVSDFGKILDPIADKLLVLGVMGAYSYLGLYSWIWVALIGFREVLVTAVRLVLLRTDRVIAAEKLGKWKTGIQFTSMIVTALYLMGRDYLPDSWKGTELTVSILKGGNYFFLLTAVALTIISGVSFFKGLTKSNQL